MYIVPRLSKIGISEKSVFSSFYRKIALTNPDPEGGTDYKFNTNLTFLKSLRE